MINLLDEIEDIIAIEKHNNSTLMKKIWRH